MAFLFDLWALCLIFPTIFLDRQIQTDFEANKVSANGVSLGENLTGTDRLAGWDPNSPLEK